MSDVPEWYANLLAAACGVDARAAKELGPDALSAVFVEDATGAKAPNDFPPIPLVIDWQNPIEAGRESAKLQRELAAFYGWDV